MFPTFKTSHSFFGVFHLTSFAFVLLATRSSVEGGICDDNKPCLGRGGCYLLKNTLVQTFSSSKCVCSKGYAGRWCQLKENDIDSEDDGNTTLKALPGIPRFTTDLSSTNYSPSYLLSWEKLTESSQFPILYFSVRYKESGNLNKWTYIEELLVDRNQTEYSYEFKMLDWNTTYDVEVYAGCILGVGEPAKGIIMRPRILYPEIFSKRLTNYKIGDDALWVDSETKLFCEARGVPLPTITWQFDGKPRRWRSSEELGFGDEVQASLNISGAGFHKRHYQCVASNFWGTSISLPITVHSIRRVVFDESWQIVTFGSHLFTNPGESISFDCPSHKFPSPHENPPTYSWGFRDPKNKTRNFDFATSKDIWVTSRGALYIRVLKQKHLSLINDNGGIRCIVTQKYSSRVVETYSRPWFAGFNLLMSESRSRPYKVKVNFVQKPSSQLFSLGQSKRFYCSVLTNSRDDTVQKWHWKSKTHDGYIGWVPKKAKVSDYGRVLDIHNLKTHDSGRITCEFHYKDEFGNEKILSASAQLRERTVPKLSIIQYPPKELSVYSGSKVSLHYQYQWQGIKPSNSSIIRPKISQWFFNGLPVPRRHYGHRDVDIGFRSLTLDNVTLMQSGIYEHQVVTEWSERLMFSVYVHVRNIREPEELSWEGHKQSPSTSLTVPAGSDVIFSCIHPSLKSHAHDRVTWRRDLETLRGRKLVTLKMSNVNDAHSFSCDLVREGQFDVFRKFQLNVVDKVNGGWSIWSSWSTCPEEQCGERSHHHRTRTCTKPLPSLNGYYCTGKMKESESCPFVPCSKEVSPAEWSHWSAWSKCSKNCGLGVETRRRTCPKAASNGRQPCIGKTTDTRICKKITCLYRVMPAKWSHWSVWSKCSKTCGVGMETRQRTCSKTSSDGRPCIGETTETQICEKTGCRHRVLTFAQDKTVGDTNKTKPPFWLPISAIVLVVIAAVMTGVFVKICRGRFLKTKHNNLLNDVFGDDKKSPHGNNGRGKDPASKNRVQTKNKQPLNQPPSPKRAAQPRQASRPAVASPGSRASSSSYVPPPPPLPMTSR